MDPTIQELESSFEREKQRAGIVTQYYLVELEKYNENWKVSFLVKFLISGPADKSAWLTEARFSYYDYLRKLEISTSRKVHALIAQFNELQTIEEMLPVLKLKGETMAEKARIEVERQTEVKSFKDFLPDGFEILPYVSA